MSRHDDLNQTVSSAVNPANLKLTWKSSEKRFIAYDTITKEKTTLGDISFIVLKETTSICGFSEAQNLGIFSNEITNINKDILTVRTKEGILLQGLYSEIKDKLKTVGASFATNLYIQLKGIKEEVSVLQLSGAALKVWFDYRELNKGKISNHWVTVKGIEEHKRGAVKYCTPILMIGTPLTKTEDVTAELVYDKIKSFFLSFKASNTDTDIPY